MKKDTTRREVLKAGIAGAGLLIVAPTVRGQSSAVQEIEKELGHPLAPGTRSLLKAALENNQNNAKERLKTPLPDCSEPCFIYRPVGKVK